MKGNRRLPRREVIAPVNGPQKTGVQISSLLVIHDGKEPPDPKRC